MEYSLINGKELRVAISGKSGCGNTTISTNLAKKLNVVMINYTFRTLSQENGMTLEEILERAKTDDSFDRMVDTRQVELALQQSCVLGSRLAIWMLKDADFKVYLYADESVRSLRIQKREGGKLDDIIAFTRKRDEEDTNRYKSLYNIDNNDYDFADCIIDVSNKDPDTIINIIIQELIQKGLVKAQ
ncbi:MAG TPA: cytidylate kinase family protein [Treponemataceae bacterium]|jgi:cytidylate kinase|nr:cytidylate kinase family protein [Treponemataceae bacterium]